MRNSKGVPIGDASFLVVIIYHLRDFVKTLDGILDLGLLKTDLA